MALFKIFSKSKVNEKSLSSSENSISSKIGKIFSHKKLDDQILEDLEDSLLTSDIGSKVTLKIIDDIGKEKFPKGFNEEDIRLFLAKYIEDIMLPCQQTIEFDDEIKPKVLIFNGVNGSGKTTTIGKIAKKLSDSGKKVMIAACDTFRAAASEQLRVWANRANCKIIESENEGQDPASIAYKALLQAKENNYDVLLIDTAGRLQNKSNLMDELRKIHNVLRKIDDNEDIYKNILVLDSTTGQNAKNQLQAFDEIIKISGLIMTKLDGSAKGGILVALAQEFKKPIYAIGVGENIEDLQEFSARNFARSLIDIE